MNQPTRPNASIAALSTRIEAPAATLAELLALWHDRVQDRAAWEQSPLLYQRLGERVLKMGAPFVAIEVATEGLDRWSKDVRLRQILGLAWARSAAPERANRILGELAAEGHCDEETLGMLARTHKDFALRATDPESRRRDFRTAYERYAEAYRLTNGYWTGINAATLANLLGDGESAAALARSVRGQCLEELKRSQTSQGDYWLLATLGEAELNLRAWTEAERWYREAADAARNRFGDLSSTRRQARLLLPRLGQSSAWIDAILRIPPVVIFAGHMIDQPGRPRPRFPQQLEPSVQNAIRDRLQKLNARIGFSSAACGSDILFLEGLLELNGEVHVVLPYEKEMFVRDSVAIFPEARWAERCNEVLRRAASVVTASNEKMEGGSVSYDYANLVLQGLAMGRAKELDTELHGLTVWDGRPGDGSGGTASVVQRWKQFGLPFELVDLSKMLSEAFPEALVEAAAPTPSDPQAPPSSSDIRVMAMFFAGAPGYSKFTEAHIPRFVQHFMGAIAQLLNESVHRAVVKNTWGDAVYLVFDNVRGAGLLALDLCDLINSTAWQDRGLPGALSLRIGLHAGPVYRCRDPIIESMTFTGTHVSRAARIEPITPPGQVYASQSFAALAAVEKVAEFTCEFVKQAEWAKSFGSFPTYAVRRS